jgi:uncharacterized protein YprB with RNaseH-like and TPR domain
MAQPNQYEGEWTTLEKNILKKSYPLLGAKVVQLLPNRTADACERQARKLGIKYGLFPLGEEAYLDIETTNFNADIAYMLSYAFKVRGMDTVYSSKITKQEIFSGKFDERLVKDCIRDLKRFKRIYTYYGTGFDIPFLRTRALEMHIDFPVFGSIQHQDIYYLVRNKLKLCRNRLENVTRLLGIDDKTHLELKIWRMAAIGDEKALQYVYDHNVIDTKILEAAHEEIKTFAGVTKGSI